MKKCLEQIQRAIPPLAVGVGQRWISFCSPDQVGADGRLAHGAVVSLHKSPAHQVGHRSGGVGGGHGGAGAARHGHGVRGAGEGGAVHIHAGSRQVRLDHVGEGVATAGVDVDAVVEMVVGSDGQGRRRVSGQRDGVVGTGIKKHRLVGDEALHRQPHVIAPGEKLGVVDPDAPDAHGGFFEPHEDQLAAGEGLDQLVIDGDHRILQQKGDAGLIAGNDGDPADGLAGGGDEAHGVGVRVGGPQLQHESTAGFLLPHADFHILVRLVGGDNALEVMGQAGLISRGNHGGKAQEAGYVLD